VRRCVTECVVSLSAVRQSMSTQVAGAAPSARGTSISPAGGRGRGSPARRRCPRDAIQRKPIRARSTSRTPPITTSSTSSTSRSATAAENASWGAKNPWGWVRLFESALRPVRGLQPLRHLDRLSEDALMKDTGRRGAQSVEIERTLSMTSPQQSLSRWGRVLCGGPTSQPDFGPSARASNSIRASVKPRPSRRHRRRVRHAGGPKAEAADDWLQVLDSFCWRGQCGCRSGSSWGRRSRKRAVALSIGCLA